MIKKKELLICNCIYALLLVFPQMSAIVDRLIHCLCALCHRGLYLLKTRTTYRVALKQRASELLMYPSIELFEWTGFIRVSHR